mgnify:CR=1 FL=1
MSFVSYCVVWSFFFFQAEDGIRDLVRSRGLGDVYKRQAHRLSMVSSRVSPLLAEDLLISRLITSADKRLAAISKVCLLYTSDAADERSSVDLGGRRIIKKKKIW